MMFRQDDFNQLMKFLVAGVIFVLMFYGIQVLTGNASNGADNGNKPSSHLAEAITGPQLLEQVRSHQNPTLVMVFASWCPHCRTQLPVIEQIALEHGDRVEVMAISIDNNGLELDNYLRSRHLNIPIYHVPANQKTQLHRSLVRTGSTFRGGIPYMALMQNNAKTLAEFEGFVNKGTILQALNK